MFDLNAASIEGHPDTIDNAQHPTPARLRCTCGSCTACRSTAALPLIVTPSAGEVSPTAGVADTRQQAEHEYANKSGAGVNETGVTASNAPVPDQEPVTTMRTQEGPGVAASRIGDVAERVSRRVSHAVMTAAVTKFEEIAGPMSLGQTTPDVVRAFVDSLRREGKSEHMVLRYLGAMKAVTQLLSTFEQCGDAGKNPFAEAADFLRPPAPSRTQAPPVALDKLQTLLSSPRYLAKKGAVEAHGAARFWVPLLCLFTYARPMELMQLQVSDLEPHRDAWVLRVSSTVQLDPQTGAALTRWVPLHDELIRCGFVSYVAQSKLDGHADLFDPGSMGEALSTRAYRVSHWFSGLGRTLGLDEGCNLLALRRAFIAACIRSGMTDEGIRLLAGRTVEIPSTLRPVQLPLSHTDELDAAVACVRQLRFDGLELSHLHATDPLASVPDAYPDSSGVQLAS